jgi:hypothetical protein
MDGHAPSRELLAGGAAIAALFSTLLIGITPWLAIPLAVTTYAGIAWLWPRPQDQATTETDRQRLALQLALANTESLRTLQQRIPKPEVREQVGRILDRIARILEVIREDGKLVAAPIVNDHILVPFLALLTEYVRLSNRDISGAGDLLEKTEAQDLPRLERALDTFYERLNRSHMVDLATLGEMLDVNLESIATTSSRRFTQ